LIAGRRRVYQLWLDPVVALGIAALAVHEGLQAWAGEERGSAVIPGLDDESAGCRDHDCCT
jgi:hypothetical protein